MNLQTRIDTLASTLESAPAQAVVLAEQLEADLLGEPSRFGEWLGRVRDCRIRGLYRLGRTREALALLAEAPARLICTMNAAGLYQAGAELALREGEPRRALALVVRAIELRIADDDARGAATAVAAGFTLMRQAGDPELLEALYAEVEARAVAAIPTAFARVLTDALGAVEEAPWFAAESPRAALRREQLALHVAAHAGRASEVRRLLAAGVAKNARNNRMPGLPTPLLAAAYLGHSEVVRALLAAGASVAVRNVQGRTALHLAADQDRAECVALLIEAGAALAAADYLQRTPLHVAARQDHQASVALLVEAGAPLAARDSHGDTVLASAARARASVAVRMLVAAGAGREGGDYQDVLRDR
jgi:ankyrin repeat protein